MNLKGARGYFGFLCLLFFQMGDALSVLKSFCGISQSQVVIEVCSDLSSFQRSDVFFFHF